MAGELVHLVLYPRFTALTGALGAEFKTTALDVTDYVTATVNVWRGAVVGGSNCPFTFEESTDQLNWTECSGTTASTDPGEHTEIQVVAHLKKRWFRLKVEPSGGVTCWALGALERRER